MSIKKVGVFFPIQKPTCMQVNNVGTPKIIGTRKPTKTFAISLKKWPQLVQRSKIKQTSADKPDFSAAPDSN